VNIRRSLKHTKTVHQNQQNWIQLNTCLCLATFMGRNTVIYASPVLQDSLLYKLCRVDTVDKVMIT